MTAGTIVLFNLHYAHSLEEGLNPELAQAKAQTSAVTFVIMFQIFYMLNCRSLRDSLNKIGFFSNPAVFLGIGIVLLLQALFIYAPVMQSIFNTTPLTWKELLFVVMSGFAIFPVISLEKWIYGAWKRKA